MNDEERRAYQETLRRLREAKAILGAAGVDLTWISRTEQAAVEQRVEKMIHVVKRLERVGFAHGWAEASAFWQDWIWPGAPHPRIVDEGLGLPRG
jgi:hypothetical protein